MNGSKSPNHDHRLDLAIWNMSNFEGFWRDIGTETKISWVDLQFCNLQFLWFFSPKKNPAQNRRTSITAPQNFPVQSCFPKISSWSFHPFHSKKKPPRFAERLGARRWKGVAKIGGDKKGAPFVVSNCFYWKKPFSAINQPYEWLHFGI